MNATQTYYSRLGKHDSLSKCSTLWILGSLLTLAMQTSSGNENEEMSLLIKAN